MNLDLPQRFRIDRTWSVSQSRGNNTGFIDIANGVPVGSLPDGGHSPYSGYATSIELNHLFNYWAVVQMDIGGYAGRSTTAYAVFFPSEKWFKEWFSAIPTENKPAILAQCAECKTGVE